MSGNRFYPEYFSQRDVLPYYTTRVECELKDGTVSFGTGFFYAFLGQSDQKHIPVIVTNRHVVKDAIVGRCRFATHNAQGGPDDLNHLTVAGGSRSEPFESLFHQHPDPEVDLCIMPMGPLIEQGKAIGKRPFFFTFDNRDLLTEEDLSLLSPLEEVVMVGYPNGLWDALNNRPLLRVGVTATDIKKDYRGNAEFLVDIACFPGSSGSPIVRLQGFSHQRTREKTVLKQKLVGVLYAGPVTTLTGELTVVNAPTQRRVVANTQAFINLAVVIKSSKLLDFEPILLAHFS